MTAFPYAIEPSTGTPLLRGMPTRATDRMELFQLGVVESLAAAAGCNVSAPIIDNGIDIDLTHELPGDEDVPLRVQLKAVTSGWNASRSAISADLSLKRYDKMRRPGVMMPSIVVIMDLPKDVDDWFASGHPHTTMQHCCYWVSLEGAPARSGKTVSVSAPATNLFDDVALCAIMARIRAGGRP